MSNSPRIFVGVFPAGICYADRLTEKDGDYKKLAFLSFSTLKLEFRNDCPRELRDEIQQDAASLQARKGSAFQISTCGQTVVLGGS